LSSKRPISLVALRPEFLQLASHGRHAVLEFSDDRGLLCDGRPQVLGLVLEVDLAFQRETRQVLEAVGLGRRVRAQFPGLGRRRCGLGAPFARRLDRLALVVLHHVEVADALCDRILSLGDVARVVADRRSRRCQKALTETPLVWAEMTE
jgi:hypothetical protein